MKTLKKIWSWLKAHWYVIPLVVAFILFIVLGGRNSNIYQGILDKYRQALQRHREDIDRIDNIRREQVERQEEIEREHAETVQEIEEKAEKERNRVESEREVRYNEILNETQGDPEKQAEQASNFWGIPVHNENKDDE